VIVDLTTGRVVDIIDPFLGSTLPHSTRKHGPGTLLKGGRALQQVTVTTSGLTFRIKWEHDVQPGHHGISGRYGRDARSAIKVTVGLVLVGLDVCAVPFSKVFQRPVVIYLPL